MPSSLDPGPSPADRPHVQVAPAQGTSTVDFGRCRRTATTAYGADVTIAQPCADHRLPLRVRSLAIAVVGVLVVAQLIPLVASEPTRRWLLLDVPVAVVGLALWGAVLSKPMPWAVLLSALPALAPTATPTATAAALLVASYCPRRQALAVGGVGVAAQLVLGWWRPVEGLPYGWWVLLVVLGYAMLVGWGAYLQERRTVLRSYRERAERAEAEQARRIEDARTAERTRIAREMHDVLAHRLSLLATHAGAPEYRPDASPERIAAAAGLVRAGVHEALDDVRDVIAVLRAGAGETRRPQPTLLDLPRLVGEARSAGSDVRLETSGDLAAAPPAVGRAGYRVVQEGLTNARRHAPGQPVDIRVSGDADGLRVTITNSRNGSGSPDGSGSGLIGLTERAELLGGTVSWDADSTFTLRAHLPWMS
jgi:signal transduction histidine kinase